MDDTPDEAIKQIIDKKYDLRFRGKLGEGPQYTGKILAVGISYYKDTKERYSWLCADSAHISFYDDIKKSELPIEYKC